MNDPSNNGRASILASRIFGKALKGKTLVDVFWYVLNRSVGAIYLRWQPLFLRRLTTPLYGHIHGFARNAAFFSRGKRVLDVGAGSKPYQSQFVDANYESTDISGDHTFLSQLTEIPQADNTYDAVFCSEVLEHVPAPYEFMAEIYRILQPLGRLYLTVPLQARNHGCPYHYFNYAEGGLRLVFEKTGFKVLQINAAGGAFHFLATNLALLPMELFQQACQQRTYLGAMGWALTIVIVQPFVIVTNCILYFLDVLDHKKAITANYLCICEKPEAMKS